MCGFLFDEMGDVDWSIDTSEGQLKGFEILSDTGASLDLPHLGILREGRVDTLVHATYFQELRSCCKAKTFDQSQDLLGIIFYLLSRYEEYATVDRDQHDRFMAMSSALYKAGAIERPIVDEILHFIAKNLKVELNNDCNLISTIDVDFPWYRKHLKFPYYLRKKKLNNDIDPYDTYERILNVHEKINNTPIFFFLAGRGTQYDKINRYDHDSYKNLIKYIQGSIAEVGIHPAYQSGFDQRVMKKTIKHFNDLTPQKPIRSRQHYLRLKLPLTYRLLIQQGISHDYSLGFADYVGFRAGTARSFMWYDLENESMTNLTIHPLVAMDVTLRNYMQLAPNQSSQKLANLKSTINRFGGNFNLLWHNSSLSEIDGWYIYKDVYFDFIDSWK